MSQRYLPLALAVLLLIALPAQAALYLQLESDSLSQPRRLASQQLLDDVRELLPPRIIRQLDQTVPVRWSSRLPKTVMARATASGQVLLNQRWLDSLTANPAAPNLPGRQHPSLRHELKAALIHELTHLYDRGRYWTDEQRRLISHCRSRLQVLGTAGLPDTCRGQTSRHRTLSDDPVLLDLAGWPQQAGQHKHRTSNNHQYLRSPDHYELHNPGEFVAVNMEYFLLDPEYACRRPALAAWLQQHFGWTPAHTPACPPLLPHLNAELQAGPALAWLDPQRIYQAHYLLADPDRSWAGRWGHSMLRLVICAPQRQPGPDCMLDLEHHLVLSYRAFVDDLQLSNWAGLTGVYPSRLYILPLQKVVDEYTRTELRSLSSIPLQLSRKQLHDLAEQAISQHWSYDGSYYFVSNNCAVETLKLLRSGTRDPRLQALDSQTPAGLLQSLHNRRLTDNTPLDNRAEAMRLGYYFDSHRERYQQLFAEIRQRLQLPQRDFTQWLALDAKQRRSLSRTPDLRTAAALLVLEQAALRQHLQLAKNDLKLRYLDNPQDNTLAGTGQLMRELLQESGILSRPADLLEQGYGLPQPADWQTPGNSLQQRYDRLFEMSTALEERFPELLDTARQKELDAIRHNLLQLEQQLKQLHQAGGGLLLP